MIAAFRRWRRDSKDLEMIIEARGISRQAALNALSYVIRERRSKA